MMTDLEIWSIMAAPREDGRDTEWIRKYAEMSPLRKVAPPQNGEPTICDGKVAIRYDYWPESFDKQFQKAPPDHPHIGRAVQLLKAWPAIYTQFGDIVSEFEPLLLPETEGHEITGSMSHQPPGTYGAIWATVNDPLALAEAFVHEMAHHKLLALGQLFEASQPLFENPGSELYDSPIRTDILRPISAVFHGMYAFMHVIALDRRILESNLLAGAERQQIARFIQCNVLRVKRGLQLIEACAIASAVGKPFLDTFFSWAKAETEAAQNQIPAENLAGRAIVIIGPTGAGKTTLVKNLSEHTKAPRLHLDAACWEIWWNSPVVRQLLHTILGESRAFLFIKANNPQLKRKVLIEFFRKGIITPQLRDALQFQLFDYVLKQFPGALIDSGAGHAVMRFPQNLERLRQLFKKHGATVILVRPVLDLEKTLTILKDRIRSRTSRDAENTIRHSLEHSSFRVLPDYVIDSYRNTEGACLQEALRILG